MKKVLIGILALVLALTLTLPALADEDDRTLTVEGSSTVTLKPDYATLQLGVRTSAVTVMEAQSENSVLMEAVIAALKACGLEEGDYSTSNFNVTANYDYSILGTEKLIGYEVSNMLSVQVNRVSDVGTVLDAAMSAGANQSYGITFGSSEVNAAYDKALIRAYEDAVHKAGVLADAAGVTLGNLKHISTNSGNSWQYGIANVYSYDTDNAAGKTSIVEGDVSVSVSVSVIFTIR